MPEGRDSKINLRKDARFGPGKSYGESKAENNRRAELPPHSNSLPRLRSAVPSYPKGNYDNHINTFIPKYYKQQRNRVQGVQGSQSASRGSASRTGHKQTSVMGVPKPTPASNKANLSSSQHDARSNKTQKSSLHAGTSSPNRTQSSGLQAGSMSSGKGTSNSCSEQYPVVKGQQGVEKIRTHWRDPPGMSKNLTRCRRNRRPLRHRHPRRRLHQLKVILVWPTLC